MITWRISARAGKKTRLHGKFQSGLKLNVRAGTVVFYIYCCTQGFYALRLWVFYEFMNFLSISWGISARSTGLKISSRVAQIGLKFSSCNRKLRFYKDFIGSLGWTFSPGWKSPCNQPLNGGLWALSSLTLFLIYLDLCDGNEVTNDIKRFTSFRGNHLFEVIEIT